MRNRRDDEDGDYCAGVIFPDVLKYREGIYRVRFETSGSGRYVRLLEAPQIFRIILPYAMADILVGMRIGLGYSWRAIIGAEMVAASTGLGHMILFAQQMSRTDKVIVGILAIGAVGYVTDRLFGWMIGFVLKGSGENGWN